ncbi:MAG: toprim domain-containing protein [Planctomycetes bacterium]|nr:toprim domain-containing protein [Planctomycetota bacterium]
MNPPGYVNIDQAQAETSLVTAAAKCGITLDVHGQGENVRIDCPFGCPGDHAGKREVSVNVTNPQKVFCCHAYGCQCRGNLLTLMHGWLTGQKPTGDKLKGAEFTRVRDVLVGRAEQAATPPIPAKGKGGKVSAETPTALHRNVPLAKHENEKARELVTIDEKLIVDVAAMSPAVGNYVRRHPCLTPESMRKWKIGFMPNDGGGDKRGFSLRGQLIYPICAEDGQILAWVGRDPQFESKEIAFNAMPPDSRKLEEKPNKHHFPKGFHRGLELFGQQANRLQEPGYREVVAQCGVVVVEGFNDVVGLDNIGIPAVAICSNRITAEQVQKIERWSRQVGNNRVTLLLDADEPGDQGAKEALWLLAQRGLDVHLGWTRGMHGGTFDGRQPESLTREEWESAIRPTVAR